jgi:serine/threonine-protein kinase HipA
MTSDRITVDVWADYGALKEPARIGGLHAIGARGRTMFSFEYDERWLAIAPKATLDPNIRPVRGEQFVPAGKTNFGMFLDSSPDRWGRVLMQRREAQAARESKRTERKLTELDYLLGVFDGHRMGGIRLRRGDGPFLDDNEDLASPPWTSLRDLEQASLALERKDAERSPRYSAWLKMLIAPGRSLGGSRPKASVLDPKRNLWLAKFPSANDDYDVGAWEYIVHELAQRASIAVAESKAQNFASRYHTFLTRRFDRSTNGERIHFASAMTLLDREDGEAGASYLDLAQAIREHGAHANRDLEELWRRIVFFMCVSNIDDHLRNHGFLLEENGWSLAPAYDMNPVAHGDGLALNVSETDNSQNLELAREVARHFGVKAKYADAVIGGVCEVVRGWPAIAKRLKLSRAEQDRMANAFVLASQGS